MSRTFRYVILICVIFLQITVLAHFTLFDIVPNYTIIVLMAIVVLCPETESLITAGVTGALLDILSGAPLGLNTLLCIYLAIVCIFVSCAIYNKRVTLFIPLCAVLSFLYEILFGVFSCLLRKAVFPMITVYKIVLPVTLINTLLFIPVYEVLRRIRTEKKRKGIKYEQ